MIEKNNFSMKINIGWYIYIIALSMMVMATAFVYWNRIDICNLLYEKGLVLSVVALLFFTKRNSVDKKNAFQVWGIHVGFMIFQLFNLRANIGKYFFKTDNKILLIQFICILIGIVFWSYKLILLEKEKKGRIGFIRNYYFSIILSAIIVILSIEQLNNSLRWDSIHYYIYIERIKDLTLLPSDVLYLRASGHLSYFYVLLYSLGAIICPTSPLGVRVESIIVFCAIILVSDCLLRKIYPNGKNGCRNIALTSLALTPVILGPIHNIDVELLIFLLVLLEMLFIINDYRVLLFINTLCLLFTKETSMFWVVAFGVAILVSEIKKSGFSKKIIQSAVNKIGILYIPFVCFFLHLSMSSQWGEKVGGEKVDKFNTWGINSVVIINKLEQFYLMNFTWIVSAFFICALCCVIVKKNRKLVGRYYEIILVPYAFYLFTQLFYITYTFPRYIFINSFYISVALCWSMNVLFKKIYTRYVFATAYIVALFLQNFVSLDCISNMLFETINVGSQKILVNSPILYLNNKEIVDGDDAKFLMFSPYGDINRQWSDFDELLNRLLEEIDYSDDCVIVYPDDFNPRSYLVYSGMWDSYYNRENKRLEQIVDDSIMSEKYIKYNMEIGNVRDTDCNKYKRTVYLKFEYSDDSEIYSKASYEKEVSYKGWKVRAYIFEKE